MLDLSQLEAFVSVATLGGFTNASRELHRSQPAISRRVSALEKQLGVRLLERRGRTLNVTPEGQALLNHVQPALAMIRDGVDAVCNPSDVFSARPLRIAVVGTLADHRLTSALETFREAHPNVDVQLRTATSREVSLLTERGEVDLGVRYFQDTSNAIECEHLGNEPLIFVASPHGPYSGKAIKGIAGLARLNFLSFPTDSAPPDSFGFRLQRELLALGMSEPRISIIDSLTAQIRLVEAGYGVALLPLSACADELATGRLERLRVKGISNLEQPVCVVYRKTVARTLLANLLSRLEAAFLFE